MSEHIKRHSDHLRARKYTANFVDDNLMATIDMVNELAVHIEKLQERFDSIEAMIAIPIEDDVPTQLRKARRRGDTTQTIRGD